MLATHGNFRSIARKDRGGIDFQRQQGVRRCHRRVHSRVSRYRARASIRDLPECWWISRTEVLGFFVHGAVSCDLNGLPGRSGAYSSSGRATARTQGGSTNSGRPRKRNDCRRRSTNVIGCNLCNLPRGDRHCRGNGTDYQLGCTRGGEPCRGGLPILPLSLSRSTPFLSLSVSLFSFSASRCYRRVRAAPAALAKPVPSPGFDQYARADAHLGRFENGRSSWSDVDQ